MLYLHGQSRIFLIQIETAHLFALQSLHFHVKEDLPGFASAILFIFFQEAWNLTSLLVEGDKSSKFALQKKAVAGADTSILWKAIKCELWCLTARTMIAVIVLLSYLLRILTRVVLRGCLQKAGVQKRSVVIRWKKGTKSLSWLVSRPGTERCLS